MSIIEQLFRSAEDKHKKRRDELSASDKIREEQLRERIRFGEDLVNEAKIIRDNNVPDPIEYQRYIWLTAGGGEDAVLRKNAAMIVKRYKLSSAAINHDLAAAKRYTALEKAIAEIDEVALAKARSIAQQKLEALEDERKRAIESFNVAHQEQRILLDSKMGYAKLKTNERRLFGTPEEMNDLQELRFHYTASGMLW